MISQSLSDLVKALKGLVVMSSELELMSNSLFINAVPELWKAKARLSNVRRAMNVSDYLIFYTCYQCYGCDYKLWHAIDFFQAYPSLKPLASWVSDLVQRISFLQNWISNGIPAVFWISGFFFPQAFLTGTLQNFARRSVVSIDTIAFDFKVLQPQGFLAVN